MSRAEHQREALEVERHQEQKHLMRELLADYDRRRSTRWGRFLLWLLKRTT